MLTIITIITYLANTDCVPALVPKALRMITFNPVMEVQVLLQLACISRSLGQGSVAPCLTLHIQTTVGPWPATLASHGTDHPSAEPSSSQEGRWSVFPEQAGISARPAPFPSASLVFSLALAHAISAQNSSFPSSVW